MEALMFTPEEAKELAGHFGALVSKVPLHPLATEDQYEDAVRVLNALLDVGGANEEHELAQLVTALGEFIADYEDDHHEFDDLPPNVVLRELMTLNGINQSQLPEVGSQGVVSELLAGKRELTRKHIEVISKRFHVSPAIFFPA